MVARIIVLLLWWGCCLATPLSAGTQEWTHTPPQWHTLGRGLIFTEVKVFRHGEEVETLAVVKVDPAFNAFRVFHSKKPRSITAWQTEIQAPVVFNASYFNPRGEPVGLVVADGKLLGPLHNRRMRGMFVAEPRGMSPDLPRATILDLVFGRINPKKLPWTQGVQSFPLLLDYKGRIRVNNTSKKAYRTVICADRNGNILIFNTGHEYFTLYDLAQFLKASTFEIDSALNLDGGSEAQMYIKTENFEYFSPSSWTKRLAGLLNQQKFLLPTVIGVFPRRD
ncbi:MAG: phosphodiester glycosidase family protein [Deltaproteobacteria bacterium]|nr:phosphodiester glycosidase family protein [Deltaproteobacteria bacterium]